MSPARQPDDSTTPGPEAALRLAEEELRKRDERHRAFLATSTEAIWRFELDEPIPTTWPVEQQVDAILGRAYLAECSPAMARMYSAAHERR